MSNSATANVTKVVLAPTLVTRKNKRESNNAPQALEDSSYWWLELRLGGGGGFLRVFQLLSTQEEKSIVFYFIKKFPGSQTTERIQTKL